MEVTGRILAVQEQRFRLALDSGEVYLLTLAGRARLSELQARGARVVVRYSGQPNLAGGVARSVQEIST